MYLKIVSGIQRIFLKTEISLYLLVEVKHHEMQHLDEKIGP